MKSHLILLLLLVSCASSVKWSPERDRRIIKERATGRAISYYDLSGELDSRNLKKLRQQRRVNNDPSWSCFDEKSTKETNYIELSDKEISFYRVHVLGRMMSDFIQVAERHNGKQRTSRENSAQDWIDIDSQRCLIRLETGEVYYVVSEKYKGGHKLWEQ